MLNGVEDIDKNILDAFLESTKNTVTEKLARRKQEFTLRMSNIGSPCVRKLWLEKNYPDDKEEFRPEAYLKFSFGDLTEEYLLFLAELAGHEVLYRQEEVEINGILGHWDAIIDGVLTDCKSASSYSFKKFKEGLNKETDAFGYLTQIASYHHAAVEGGYPVDRERAAFLVFDKQHGHICLDVHRLEKKDWGKFYEERKTVVNGPDLPQRAFDDVPEGKSGNRKLGVNCSYCDMKKKCFPGLRTFIYANGPVYLTEVKREPNVPEVIQSTNTGGKRS